MKPSEKQNQNEDDNKFIEVEDKWVQCPECKRKFFKGTIVAIEIKCPRCKQIYSMEQI